MSASIPFVVLLILVHLGIFLTSSYQDRLKKLIQALLVIVLAVPLTLAGYMIAQQGGSSLVTGVLMNSPLFMPVLAFLVYVRQWRRKSF